MSIRYSVYALAIAFFAAMFAPAAIAADLTDVGFIDQAELASLPIFVSANKQLFDYKAQLDAQYNDAMKSAKTDADKQRISMQFQQQYSDKQNELVGPLFQRAQLAIAAICATRNLSIVVDKRIVIYGGQDITKDVETLFNGSAAIQPPAASPPPSEIGYVDQSALDNLPKVKSANDQMNQYATTQRALYAPRLAAATNDTQKQQLYAEYNKELSAKQDALLTPLVNQTKAATAAVAKSKNIVLVIDAADRIYGGTDITPDVQNALNK